MNPAWSRARLIITPIPHESYEQLHTTYGLVWAESPSAKTRVGEWLMDVEPCPCARANPPDQATKTANPSDCLCEAIGSISDYFRWPDTGKERMKSFADDY
jgi:hypothetical protein